MALRKVLVASLLCGAVAMSAAWAQDPQPSSASGNVASEVPQEGESNWAGYASLGASLLPEYEGSNSYILMPYVEGRLNYKNYYARFEGGTLRFNLIDNEAFHAGPLIGFRRGRGNVNSPVHSFKHLDDTETAGGFIEWEHVAEDPRSGETVYLTADNAVYGEKGGWQIVLRGTARRPIEWVNPGFIVSLTGDLSWVSRPYMQKYFGVTPSDSIASGMPIYTPGDGFNRAGVALSVDQFLSRHFSVGLRGYYASLLGKASSSPVTSSSDQFFAGVVAGYVL
ncbi:outer membrane scaffolding protein for murein synthesis (MipA/OmpV family) [Rhizomicrobium palustre]|uniref:Outer membrane scaffolding protein for murein synthesis (MipA/OmpV family) n=1 Tax=Rhizomicrobium palustre TaxID=189966 RepID=A0A846MXC6_9PROT|nr:MipA/OmpV family protein [Rhizomicrobium palustre]NIK87712.1 outer membrane scaffolding protein for murein synthesis (MipA/OmpV family) [Rhizomicrobium palustre]